MSPLLKLRSVIKRWSCCTGTQSCLRMQDWVHAATSDCHAHLVVQITELLHQVFGDPCPGVGLVVSHAILSEQADAPHAPLFISGVLQQPVFLCQVVDRVPIGSMDPGGSKLQSCFSWQRKKIELRGACELRSVYFSFSFFFTFTKKPKQGCFPYKLVSSCIGKIALHGCHIHMWPLYGLVATGKVHWGFLLIWFLQQDSDGPNCNLYQRIYSWTSCKCSFVRDNT